MWAQATWYLQILYLSSYYTLSFLLDIKFACYVVPYCTNVPTNLHATTIYTIFASSCIKSTCTSSLYHRSMYFFCPFDFLLTSLISQVQYFYPCYMLVYSKDEGIVVDHSCEKRECGREKHLGPRRGCVHR